DVRPVAGGDPAGHGGVEVAPAAGEDLQLDVGVVLLEARERHVPEPVQRVLGQPGDVDLEGPLGGGRGRESAQRQRDQDPRERMPHAYLHEGTGRGRTPTRPGTAWLPRRLSGQPHLLRKVNKSY